MVIHHGTGDPFLPVGLAQHALRISGVHAYAVPAVTRTLWVTPPLSLGQPLWSCELIWMTQSTMSAAVGNFVHQLRTDSKSTQGCGIDRCRIRRSSSRYEPLALQAGKLVQFSFSRTPALTRRLSTAVSHGTSRVQSCHVATRARNRLGSPLIRHRLTAPERTVVTKTSTLCRQCMLWQWARRHAGVLAACVELPD